MSHISHLPKLVVFGEALTDFIIQENQQYAAHSGGSCWNVARVAARLGIPTAYAGSVSRDIFGQQLYQLALQAGCDKRFIQQVDKAPFLAMVTHIHPPHYFFIGTDSADLAFNPDLLPDTWMMHAQWVHFGCISLARMPLADRLLQIALQAFEQGIKISFDPNWRALMQGDQAYYQRFVQLAAISHLIKVSDEDLAHLFPDSATADRLILMQNLAPHAAILYTLGDQGMQYITPTKHYTQAVIAASVADTVGAGDAAIGGFLSSLMQYPNEPPTTHLRFAAATACCVCQHSGAYAPTLQEVTLLHSNDIPQP